MIMNKKTEISLIEDFIISLFPKIKIDQSKWQQIWNQNQIERSRKVTLFSLSILGIAHLAQLIFLDHRINYNVKNFWLIYRLIQITFAVAGFILVKRWRNTSLNISLFILLINGFVNSIGQSYLLYSVPGIPFYFSFVIPAIFAIVFNYGPITSILFFLVILSPSLPLLINTQYSEAIPSSIIISCAATFLFRINKKFEVDAFIEEQKNIEYQRALIEKNLEINQQIKRFCSTIHYNRIQENIKSFGMTGLQATDDVFRQSSKEVVILYGDIRNYTKRTRDLAFIEQVVSPCLRGSMNILNRNFGIPNTFGDAVFSYFDFKEEKTRMMYALASAIELNELTDIINKKNPETHRIKRNFILTLGTGTVGNVGGTDGSAQPTVLGDCANLPSRIDIAIKSEKIRETLENQDVVVSDAFYKALINYFKHIPVRSIELSKQNLIVPDFDETYLHILRLDERSKNIILEFLRKKTGPYDIPFKERNLERVS